MADDPRFEDAFSLPALHRAYRKALRRHRRDAEAAAFALECGPRLCALWRALTSDRWRPGPMRFFRIRDPKPREIAVLPFADRVVHHALVAAIEPLIDERLDPDSHACRKDMGLHRAVLRLQGLLRRCRFALQLDIRKYFASLPHESVLGVLRAAPFALPARYEALLSTVLAGGRAVGSTAGRGMPIGALTSQLLGSVGLHPAEALLRARFAELEHVRYMDDIVVCGPTKAGLWAAHAAVDELVRGLGLALKSEATRLVPATEGVAFLGFRVYPGALHLAARDRRRLGRAIARDARRLGRGSEARRRAAIATRLQHAAFADTLGWRRALATRLALDQTLWLGTGQAPARTA